MAYDKRNGTYITSFVNKILFKIDFDLYFIEFDRLCRGKVFVIFYYYIYYFIFFLLLVKISSIIINISLISIFTIFNKLDF